MLLGAAAEDVQRLQVADLERRANEKLKAELGPRWSEKDLDVQFNVDGTNLEILVYDEGGADTSHRRT